jgi:hypothetical protein
MRLLRFGLVSCAVACALSGWATGPSGFEPLPHSSGVIQSLPVQLPVKETFSELHLLTAVEPGPAVAEWKASAAQARAVGERLPDRLTLAVATLQYADGSTVQIPLRYGESLGAAVRDWWNPEDGFIYHLPFAEIASAQVQEGPARRPNSAERDEAGERASARPIVFCRSFRAR